MEELSLTVSEEFVGERIDVFISHAMEIDLSRSRIQRLIRDSAITVNGTVPKPSHRVAENDAVIIRLPEPETLDLEPENIPVDIVYQDSALAVINKQPGLVVHPGPGNWRGTLVNALLHHLRDLSSIGGTVRPGIVHRLDKDTSGLMIVAKTDRAHQALVEAFGGRAIEKRYAAIIAGKPASAHAIIDRPIGRHPVYRHKMTIREDGRAAITEYTVNNIWNGRMGIFSLLDVRLHTGRTHQIRVHLAAQGTPIAGDPLYSKKWQKHRVPFLLLCSTGIAFSHPETGDAMRFEIPLPPHFMEFIARLEAS